MNFDEFISKYDDDYVDIDGMYGNQCKDLFSAYNDEVVGVPFYVFGNANQLFDAAPDEYYEKIKNTPDGVPQKGDVIIWSTAPYGHVAIFVSGDMNSFISFDQNFPVGSPCHTQNHNYNNVIGWLRPKKQQGEDNMNHEQVIATIRKARTFMLSGPLDNVGAEADAKRIETELAGGNQYSLEQLIFDAFPKASNYQLMKKADCKPQIITKVVEKIVEVEKPVTVEVIKEKIVYKEIDNAAWWSFTVAKIKRIGALIIDFIQKS